MTNEELAISIADGNKDLIGELYQKNRGLLYKHAKRFYILHSERCASAGVTLDDMMNECYFAVYSAAKAYAKSERKYKFTSFLHYSTLNYFLHMVGMRTERQRKEPLNSCKSLDAPIDGTEDLTLCDTVEDVQETENAERLIDRLVLREVFPEVKKVFENEPQQYELIYAIYHDNIARNKLAEIKGVTAEAIRQQQTRALQQLRKEHKRFDKFCVDVIDLSLRRGGLETYRNTNTSSVEWAVLRIIENMQR